MSFCPFEELLGLLLQLLKRTKALSRKLLFGQGIVLSSHDKIFLYSAYFNSLLTLHLAYNVCASVYRNQVGSPAQLKFQSQNSPPPQRRNQNDSQPQDQTQDKNEHHASATKKRPHEMPKHPLAPPPCVLHTLPPTTTPKRIPTTPLHYPHR